jgi:hypothetical protein
VRSEVKERVNSAKSESRGVNSTWSKRYAHGGRRHGLHEIKRARGITKF